MTDDFMRTPATNALKHVFNPKTRTQRQWSMLVFALLALDALCVIGSLILAYFVRIDGVLPYYSSLDAAARTAAYRGLVEVAVPLFVMSFVLQGLYQQDNLLGGVVEYKQVIKGCALGVGMLMAYTVFARESDFGVSRGWLIISWLLTTALVGSMRFCVRRIVYGMRGAGYFSSRVLIVGANDQGLAIASQWLNTPASGMHIVGFLDDFKAVGTPVTQGLKVLGRPSAIDALSHKYEVEEVVVVSSAVAWESFGEIVTNMSADKRYTLRLSPGFYELLTTGVAVTNKTFVPLFTINDSRIVGIDAVLKAVFDYGLGGLLTLAALPVMLVIALGLKLRRPHVAVISRYSVIGRNGQTFAVRRFNTATVAGGAQRRFERWLRMTGLSKLPELLSVLQGDMSLVGPHTRAAHNQVTDMHTMHNLQAVKPGIVGPWLRRDHMLSPSLLHDELNYIRNWTIWADLPILFQAATTFVLRFIYAGNWTSAKRARPALGSTSRPRSIDRTERNLTEDLA